MSTKQSRIWWLLPRLFVTNLITTIARACIDNHADVAFFRRFNICTHMIRFCSRAEQWTSKTTADKGKVPVASQEAEFQNIRRVSLFVVWGDLTVIRDVSPWDLGMIMSITFANSMDLYITSRNYSIMPVHPLLYNRYPLLNRIFHLPPCPTKRSPESWLFTRQGCTFRTPVPRLPSRAETDTESGSGRKGAIKETQQKQYVHYSCIGSITIYIGTHRYCHKSRADRSLYKYIHIRGKGCIKHLPCFLYDVNHGTVDPHICEVTYPPK